MRNQQKVELINYIKRQTEDKQVILKIVRQINNNTITTKTQIDKEKEIQKSIEKRNQKTNSKL